MLRSTTIIKVIGNMKVMCQHEDGENTCIVRKRLQREIREGEIRVKKRDKETGEVNCRELRLFSEDEDITCWAYVEESP